ncbi:MAG: hypothetical protein KC417_01060 [Myxococcales bacterium]|nr:hypothetical protein [Myxococcales bacterium]
MDPEHDTLERPHRMLVAITAIAAPVALVFEWALRRWALGDALDEVRAALGPYATFLASGLALVSIGLAVVAAPLFRALATRAFAKIPPEARAHPGRRTQAITGAFLIASSVVQLPALVATLAYTFGASFGPVALCLACSCVGVVHQGFLRL